MSKLELIGMFVDSTLATPVLFLVCIYDVWKLLPLVVRRKIEAANPNDQNKLFTNHLEHTQRSWHCHEVSARALRCG